MSSDIHRILERLAAAVVRAFYDDQLAVVMDMLIRHRQVRDDMLGKTIGLGTKQVRKAIQQLQAEGLVHFEKANDDDRGHASTYWFVNYRRLVAVVTWRLHRMQELLEEREKKEQQRQNYTCPQCNEGFTSLEVQRLVNGGKGFCCCHCCPHDMHFKCGLDSQVLPYALMESVQQGFDKAKRDLERFKVQLSASRDHDGIFDLLQQLKEITEENKIAIPSNLPSENFQRGIGTGRPAELAANPLAKGDGRGGRKGARATRMGAPDPRIPIQHAPGTMIEVEIRREDSLELASEDDYVSAYMRGKKREREYEEEHNKLEATKSKKALPTFLGESRISGPIHGSDSLKESPELHSADTSISSRMVQKTRRTDNFNEEYQKQMANLKDTHQMQSNKMEIEVKVDCTADSSGSESSFEDEEDYYGVEWNPGYVSPSKSFSRNESLDYFYINFDAVIEVGNQAMKKRVGDVTVTDIENMTTDQYCLYYNFCSDTIQLP
mmetsp:Transcript_28113/g.36838  ORF Transcript_28113/g.36838 Transcript_28113/m.36838 type:complete len:493 (-) Transcript_28113:197-1675(-)|eukprot:CAMPEP_0117751542 /NCGR_PEP_ID=MMETSP0947-20121206/11040_1 /TAXON_ID=44440 /ORGANISM="Chattonella subsalsa, Strain CCMP2191" /LENGTH=492 /DNA_ID=CAMNT_0005569949 /DNA_START=230 /DNA_END=1708 /DNA_ORIENTATION=+